MNDPLSARQALLLGIIQGLTVEQHTGEYPELPWRLGLIRRVD